MTGNEHDEWQANQDARKSAHDKARRPIPNVREPQNSSGGPRRASGPSKSEEDWYYDLQDPT